MFVEERQALIIEQIQSAGNIKVKELSTRFKVTEDLIRKDLKSLEKQGLLKRVYGGAVAIKQNLHREMVAQRRDLNLVVKQQIAKKALSLIKDNYVVFLDISTVNIELAKLLVKNQCRVTVVTNMLDVVNILAKSSVHVIFIGGEFDASRDGFVGSLALSIVKQFRFDIAFLGVVGIDISDNAVMTYLVDDGIMKKEILGISKRAYMMCEQEKLFQMGNYVYAKLEAFSGIITDKVFSSKEQQDLEVYNLDII